MRGQDVVHAPLHAARLRVALLANGAKFAEIVFEGILEDRVRDQHDREKREHHRHRYDAPRRPFVNRSEHVGIVSPSSLSFFSDRKRTKAFVGGYCGWQHGDCRHPAEDHADAPNDPKVTKATEVGDHERAVSQGCGT